MPSSPPATSAVRLGDTSDVDGSDALCNPESHTFGLPDTFLAHKSFTESPRARVGAGIATKPAGLGRGLLTGSEGVGEYCTAAS